MKATYSAGNHNLCKLEIPSGVAGEREVADILEQVVPLSLRGARRSEITEFSGISGYTNAYYERVLVSQQIFTSGAIHENPGAVVEFKEKRCGWKTDVFDTPPKPDSPPRQKQ